MPSEGLRKHSPPARRLRGKSRPVESARRLKRRRKLLNCYIAFIASLILAFPAAAQDRSDWDQIYLLSGTPALRLDVLNSNLNLRSCGDCQTVHIRISAPQKNLSDYHVEQHQIGNSIRFSLKERTPGKHHFVAHAAWSPAIQVEVETPHALILNATTAEGLLTASDLSGDITLQSSDGNQQLIHLQGTLKLSVSDGHLSLKNSSGTLDAQTHHSSLDFSGSFSSLHLQATDGDIKGVLSDASTLTVASRIEAFSGSITLRVPRTFNPDLHLEVTEGKIRSNLPLAFELADASHQRAHLTPLGAGPTLTLSSIGGSLRLYTR